MDKPTRPIDFPLFAHATKRWAKKVKGKLCYYGSWSAGADAALAEYLRCKDYDLAGRKRPPKDAVAGITVKFVVDSFLTRKQRQRDAGEIQQRTFAECFKAGVRLAAAFGRDRLVIDLLPDDFAGLRAELSKTLGPVALGNEIVRMRSVFKHAYENGLIDHPVRFGDQFSTPSKKLLRIERAKRGKLDIAAEDIRTLIDAADVHMRAMICLGINAGFVNADCGSLPRAAVDLAKGWIEFPRPKTGASRKAKLWPETVAALTASLAQRPKHKHIGDADLFFLTPVGLPWCPSRTQSNALSKRFHDLLVECGLHRDGIGFYSLRRTFLTVAGQTLDIAAVDLVMGHAAPDRDMGSRYTQWIDDARLERVAGFVRDWLFAGIVKN